MAPLRASDACERLDSSGGGRLQLFRADVASFATVGHGVPSLQVGVLLRGQVRIETPAGLLVNDARESPKVWVMPANMPLAVTALPGYPPVLLGAAFDPAEFDRYLQEATRARVAAPGAPAVLHDPVAALGLEAFHRSFWAGAAPLEWESWLVTSLRRLFGGQLREASPSAAAEPRGVAIARDYLHAHYRDAVPLERLAELAGISKYHLVRAFRASVGVPPHTYQLRLRLTRSLLLLGHGLSPAAIALELGFADQSHFTRAFRAEFGTTPAAWIRTSAAPRAHQLASSKAQARSAASLASARSAAALAQARSAASLA